MRHRQAHKHLNRTPSHRLAMRRNLAASLFEHGVVRTTEPKAKDVRRFVEKLITKAKKNTVHARRQVIAELQDRNIAKRDPDGEVMFDKRGRTEFEDKTVVQRLFEDIAPRYADRDGGYTRIIRLSETRIGDSGSQVLLQLVEETSGEGESRGKPSGRRSKRAAKRHEAASAVATDQAPAEQAEAPAEAEEETPAEETAEQAEGAEQTEASDEETKSE